MSRQWQGSHLSFAGFTLVELLIVMGLLAVLMGFGVGFLSRRGNDLDQTLFQIRDLARAARSSARFYRAPARLEIDPAPQQGPATQGSDEILRYRKLRVVALRPVTEWNFDRGTAFGTRDVAATMIGASIEKGGRFGNCLVPAIDSGRPGLRCNSYEYPGFRFDDGFVSRVDLYLDRAESCLVYRNGQSFELSIDASGHLSAQVTYTQQSGHAGQTLRLRSFRRVPIGRWFKVELASDSQSCRLALDYMEVDSKPSQGRVFHDPRGELIVSGASNPVPGRIDSLEFLAYEVTVTAEVPMTVQLLGGPGILNFAPGGSIDRRFHAKLPVYRVRMEDVEERIEFETGGLAR